MSLLSAQLSALSLNGSTCSTRSLPARGLKSTCIRSFSMTPIHNRRHAKKQLHLEHKDVPEYPHGPARLYKKSNFGLYAGSRVRFGNIVSKGKWVKKTRRKWWPNVHETHLFSQGLNKKIPIKVTNSVLRTIDKVGGLDNYLLGSTSQRIKDLGMAGWKLRWELMQTPFIQARFRRERAAMGLPKQGTGRTEHLQQVAESFKKVHAIKPVAERAAGYFNKRQRKDVWRGQLLPVYEEAVRSAFSNLPRTEDGKIKDFNSISADAWYKAEDDVRDALLYSKA